MFEARFFAVENSRRANRDRHVEILADLHAVKAWCADPHDLKNVMVQ